MSLLLSELICTRISHDIIGTVGAVGNAVELLEDGDMDFIDDIKSILRTSSDVLNARMKFFRLTFGLDNANLQNNGFVCQILRDYLQTIGNKNFPLVVDISSSISSGMNRFLLAGAMMMADFFIRGGRLSIREENNRLFFRAEAEAGLASEKIAAAAKVISGKDDDCAAWLAVAYYLREQARIKALPVHFSTEQIAELIIG